MEGGTLILRMLVILVTLVRYVKLVILKELYGDRNMENLAITLAQLVRQ
jgi:hypothetical protein